jgi:hypothetical protein
MPSPPLKKRIPATRLPAMVWKTKMARLSMGLLDKSGKSIEVKIDAATGSILPEQDGEFEANIP